MDDRISMHTHMERLFAGYPAGGDWEADSVDIRQGKWRFSLKMVPDIHADLRGMLFCRISGRRLLEGLFTGYPAEGYWAADFVDIRQKVKYGLCLYG